jgi:hypothetical protein
VSSAVFLAAPHVAATTDGFYIVAWTQDSTAIVQKVSASGMPQWGDPGIVLTPSGGGSYSVSDVVASDSGSAIVGLVRTLSGVRRTHTQKFSADGAQQWGGGSPVVVMDTTSLQQGNFPPLMSDGAGGALYWWYEVSGVALQCRVQHLDSAGAELFPHNGAAAATQAGRYRVSPTIAYLPDGQTTIMFWTEENTSQSQWGISAQKFNGVGARQWTDNGVTLVPLSGMQNAFLRAVPYADGAMVFGFDRQNAAQVIGIRVDGAGTQVWAGSPIAACSVLSSKSRLDIAQATDGGALLAWSDGRNDGGDIYAQRVNPDGTLGPSPCRADFNQNGVLNSQDFFDFISAFFMGGPTADFNGDATVNSQDFFDYLTAFFAGCA